MANKQVGYRMEFKNSLKRFLNYNKKSSKKKKLNFLPIQVRIDYKKAENCAGTL